MLAIQNFNAWIIVERKVHDIMEKTRSLYVSLMHLTEQGIKKNHLRVNYCRLNHFTVK